MLYIFPLISYLIGSIPFGLMLGKALYKVDVRNAGSGNIGSTNVFRVCGKVAGILTFILDATKGVITLALARIYFDLPSPIEHLICILAIFGHAFPVFLKFKGGKAVATSFACIAILYLPIAVLLLLFWIITMLIFRKVGLASVVTSVFLILISTQIFLITQNILPVAFFLVISLLILLKHIPNIKDIRSKLS